MAFGIYTLPSSQTIIIVSLSLPLSPILWICGCTNEPRKKDMDFVRIYSFPVLRALLWFAFGFGCRYQNEIWIRLVLPRWRFDFHNSTGQTISSKYSKGTLHKSRRRDSPLPRRAQRGGGGIGSPCYSRTKYNNNGRPKNHEPLPADDGIAIFKFYSNLFLPMYIFTL